MDVTLVEALIDNSVDVVVAAVHTSHELDYSFYALPFICVQAN